MESTIQCGTCDFSCSRPSPINLGAPRRICMSCISISHARRRRSVFFIGTRFLPLGVIIKALNIHGYLVIIRSSSVNYLIKYQSSHLYFSYAYGAMLLLKLFPVSLKLFLFSLAFL